MTLNEKQEALCDGNEVDSSELSGVFLICALKRPIDGLCPDAGRSGPA